jgi:uncharacterized protein
MSKFSEKYVSDQRLHSLCQEEGIKYLAIFGSYARDEAVEGSDIDLLVDFIDSKGMFTFVRLKRKLEVFFQKKVDLVTIRAISKFLVDDVKAQLEVLYESA